MAGFFWYPLTLGSSRLYSWLSLPTIRLLQFSFSLRGEDLLMCLNALPLSIDLGSFELIGGRNKFFTCKLVLWLYPRVYVAEGNKLADPIFMFLGIRMVCSKLD